MYIAVELNGDGSVNDIGEATKTPEKAWDAVKQVFWAPDTTIYKLTPAFKVNKTEQNLIPIKG